LLKSWKRNNLKLQKLERKICPKKYKVVAGVDEVGRGPLAGPVVASAVIIKDFSFTTRIFDSKKLSFGARKKAYAQILKRAHIGVGIASREIVDQKNVSQATLVAMKMALDKLGTRPDYVLIDGNFKRKQLPYRFQSVVGGDASCFSIACASIVAKVLRDNLMSYYSALYSGYGFERNRGYCTKEHLKGIKKYGITPIHRRSFRPIREQLNSLKVSKVLTF